MYYELEPRYRTYLETLIPQVVEIVVIGLLVNLLSDYVGSWLKLDGFSAFLLLFLLLGIIALYVQYQRQRSGWESAAPQKPTELGSMLSLMFFARFLFLNCSEPTGLDNWLLTGIGAAPFLAGLSLTSILEKKNHALLKDKFQGLHQSLMQAQEAAQRAQHEAHTAKQALQKAEAAARRPQPPTSQNPPDEEWERRINMRAVIQADLDVEHQPGVLLIIIESILSVKNAVTQLEIFEVCRILARKLPSARFMELIRDFMGRFVNLRQAVRNVELDTSQSSDWKISERSGKVS